MGRSRPLALLSAAVLGAAAAAALVAGSHTLWLAPERTALSGVIGNDAGMASHWEGSNAKFGMPSYSNDAMNAKEEETGFGVAGQLGTGEVQERSEKWVCRACACACQRRCTCSRVWLTCGR